MNSPFAPAFAANPFLAQAVSPSFDRAAEAEVVVATPAPEAVSYALVASGPSVPAEEVETLATAVEVTVRWGAQVLLVKHLGPGKSFRLGEGGDFVLPEDVASIASDLVARRPEGACAGERHLHPDRAARADQEAEQVQRGVPDDELRRREVREQRAT